MSLFKEMFSESIHSLSDKEKVIFEFISLNTFLVSEMNLKDLSLYLNVSEYLINKFCKKLNLDNFANLSNVLKEFSKHTQQKCENIFMTTKEIMESYLSRMNEIKISDLSKLILDHGKICIICPESSKIIGKYLEQKLSTFDINITTTSSPKTSLKRIADINLVIYIAESINENEIRECMDLLSNKSLIILSNTMVKDIHDKSFMFVYIEGNKITENYKIRCSGNYFVFIDLLICKIIELINAKN